MWFLWFWLISSACCEIALVLVAYAIKGRLMREIPKLQEREVLGSWKGRLKSLLIMLIPFLNILIALVMLFAYDSIYSNLKERFSRQVD